MQQVAKSLQSAQQSLQQAGQQQASNGQSGQSGKSGQQAQAGQEGEASEAEMGKEFRQGGSVQEGNGNANRDKSQSGRPGGGMGRPGQGFGGHAGAQQPLPGKKKDELVAGTVNDKGQKLTRSYMGTPDPTRDRAAYYSIVPEKIRAQESSLNREEIPAGYKKQVRDYFESLQK